MGMIQSILLVLSILAQHSSGIDQVSFLQTLNDKNAPIFVTGCTSVKDAYHKEKTSFALISAGGETALISQQQGETIQVLSTEVEIEGGLYRESHAGMWSSAYAQDIWENLKEAQFTREEPGSMAQAVPKALKQTTCAFKYDLLYRYENHLKTKD